MFDLHKYIIYSDDIVCVMSVTLHTSLGDVKIEIFCEFVPKTAKNFLALCASNYYDDTIFHRNIRGFMIQGGDPTGTGKGGKSIYTTHASGKFEDEIVDSLKHSKRGIVSMANSGPNTNGSQFFITYKQHAHLNGKYTVFGHVIDGLDTLDKMERVPTGPGDRPVQEIRLQSVTIHANPLAA
jgi:peptidyl-prolyl cis-trans isomerase-like 3